MSNGIKGSAENRIKGKQQGKQRKHENFNQLINTIKTKDDQSKVDHRQLMNDIKVVSLCS